MRSLIECRPAEFSHLYYNYSGNYLQIVFMFVLQITISGHSACLSPRFSALIGQPTSLSWHEYHKDTASCSADCYTNQLSHKLITFYIIPGNITWEIQ